MKTLISLVMTLACLTLIPAANAQNYAIDWFTIDGGGGTSSGGPYSLSGTIGQPDASGLSSGGNFTLNGGFWQALGPVPPVLFIQGSNASVRVYWPRPATGFLLESTMQLQGPGNTIWSPVSEAYETNATQISITVQMPNRSKFYRLRQ